MAYIPRSELTPEQLAAKRAADHERYQRRKAGLSGGTGRPKMYSTSEERLQARRAYGRAYYHANKANKESYYSTARARDSYHKRNDVMMERALNGEDTIGMFLGYYYNNLKKGAVARGIPFELTKEQLELVLYRANGKCSLSGIDIMFARKAPNVASVDRIDSNKGYTMDNVQVVHAAVNIMKMDLSVAEFKELCTAVAFNSHL